MCAKRRTLNIENAQIGFRNFAGLAGKFNPAGKRNFVVFLDYDQAEMLERDGWNIRWLKAKDEDVNDQAYLPVSVNFDQNVEPKIILISSKGKTILKEDEIHILDWAEIVTTDVIITPYYWDVNGKKGVKAYLKIMYVTIQEDEFARKYEDVPDSASSSFLRDDD